LNSIFWVFDERSVNSGVVNHLRSAAPNRDLSRVKLTTRDLPDQLIEEKIRLSAINGGGSNGASSRGTATYKGPLEWSRGWPPKEIGIWNGVPPDILRHVQANGGLTIEDVP